MGKKMKVLRMELFPNICQKIEILGDLSLGRENNNQIILKDMSASGQHALIGLDGDKVWIEDLGSTNGTYVNDTIIHKEILKDKDVISIGYTKILFFLEEDYDECFNVDTVLLEKNLQEKEVVCTNIPSEGNAIQKWFGWFLEKLTAWNIQDFGKAVLTALEDACERSEKKGIFCRVQKNSQQLRVTIRITGQGIEYESQIRNILQRLAEEKSNLAIILQNSDSFEFDIHGKEVTLTKIFKSAKLSKDASQDRRITFRKKGETRYFAVRYSKQVKYQVASPIKIVISDYPTRSFPENLEAKTSTSSANPVMLELRPIYPGCLMTPPSQEVNICSTPNKIEFWMTPLSKDAKDVPGVMQILKDGNVIQTMKTPVHVLYPETQKRLFWASIWLPILFIAIDIPNIPLHQDLPLLVLYFLQVVQWFGGWSLLGIFLGLLSLGYSTWLHWQNRTQLSDILHFDIKVS